MPKSKSNEASAKSETPSPKGSSSKKGKASVAADPSPSLSAVSNTPLTEESLSASAPSSQEEQPKGVEEAPKATPVSAGKKKGAKVQPIVDAQPADDIPYREEDHLPAPSISDYLLDSHKKIDHDNEAKLTPFLRQQKARLLLLRDAMLDSMNSVAQDNLRARAEGSEASAFGMHQADAGSDAYDRDFALSLLSQEQDALYEIDEALKRIELGAYGVCEMSGKPINDERLEAIPFTRFTVECQSQIERQNKAQRVRQSVTSLFGLTDEGDSEKEEEEFSSDNNKE